MEIKFWKVGCGDAITISYLDSLSNKKHIFVDSGFQRTYFRTIQSEIKELEKKNEIIDLWIITHPDRDHIGGLEAFLKDSSISEKEKLVKEYWFNWCKYEFTPRSNNLSFKQAINLRDYLCKTDKIKLLDITSNISPVHDNDACVTILSPSKEVLMDCKIAWQNIETKSLRVSGKINDYAKTIESLINESYEEDTDIWNISSIAFIFEQRSNRILFLADSISSTIIEELKRLGYSKDRKLNVDFVKLAHHGSKRNFKPELLELINCTRFILLADGIGNNLPDKWTLAHIICNPNRNKDEIIFYFNDSTKSLKNIFSVDKNLERYNFKCIFNDNKALQIVL